MPRNQQFDALELRSLALPYDTTTYELSPEPRFIGGLNMIVSKGKLVKRPAYAPLFSLTGFSTTNRMMDHFIYYETIDNPTKRYFVGSYYDTTTGFYAVVINEPSTAVNYIPTLRNVHKSLYPHEFTVSRGICYIKAFTRATDDTLGTIQFNGSSQQFMWWGLLGPTTPAALTGTVVGGVFTPGAWPASTFNFTVNYGWYYTYTYKTINGQESCRAPIQVNQSLNPSGTGSFSNTCPTMTVQGQADTTNVPYIAIYRTTDGGGTFYRIDQIANTGAGSITYTDRNFPDGLATPQQPVSDISIDTTQVAPSLTLNSPPPSVASQNLAFATLNGALTAGAGSITINTTFNGANTSLSIGSPPQFFWQKSTYTVTIDAEQMLVSGINQTTGSITRGVNGTTAMPHANGATLYWTPVVGQDSPQQSSPMSVYSGRIWYGLGNVLFYSGQEEIGIGVPEECFPSGLQGNFFRFSYPITNTIATSEALYVICSREIYWIRGTTRDQFQAFKLFSDIGGASTLGSPVFGQAPNFNVACHPRSATTADKSIIFLTSDYRICLARGYNREFISDPIAKELFGTCTGVTTEYASATLSSIHLARYQLEEKDLLVMAACPIKFDSIAGNLSNGKIWVYDFNQGERGLWNTPWQPTIAGGTGVTCLATGYPFESNPLYYLTLMSAGNTSSLNMVGAISAVDFINLTQLDYNNYNIAWNYTLSALRNPTGNHVNTLRLPGMTSILHAVKLDRTAFSGDSDPTVNYALDTINAGSYTSGNYDKTAPPRRTQSSGYTTLWYELDLNCERVTINVVGPTDTHQAEHQSLALLWVPDKGA